MLTRIAQLEALIDINIAVWSLESSFTFALISIAQRGALGSISAGLVSTVVLLLTVMS